MSRQACIALLGAVAAACALPCQAQSVGGGSAALPMVGCGGDLSRLNQLSGWQMSWPETLRGMAGRPRSERLQGLAQWRTAPAALDADVAALRRGLASGEAASAAVAARVRDQVEGLRAGVLSSELPDPEWRDFVRNDLAPAVARYSRFLTEDYIPHAPAGSSLVGLPGGEACFEKAVKSWTSVSMSPDALEALGRKLLLRYRAELAELAGRPPEAATEVVQALRAESAHQQATRQQILEISKRAIARAEAKVPAAFGEAPVSHLEVSPIEPGLESSLPAGFYQQAAGGAPARYEINLSRPAERRLMAEAIAFHEGVPGHHLGFSMAKGPGAFNSGFVEGWGIYAEHLADELGLYSSTKDRMGAAAKHLWAASRLVVEPGLHVRGWSRAQAIDFMRQNTTLPDREIEIEVDRYLGVPGQSLSYMVGYEAIRSARARAETRQGDAFDLRRFHQALLQPGSRALDQLTQEFP